MRGLNKSLAILLTFSVAAMAQTQLATITSESSFQLRGAQVTPGEGVPSWPVMAGDTIQAGEANLTLTFTDGSTIILAPGSTGTVDLSGTTPVFHLQSGTIHYLLKKNSTVTLEGPKGPIATTGLAGDASVGTTAVSAGWWTTGHTVAVLGGAAGAAGLAVGVAAATKVSKSNCKGTNPNSNCQ